MDTSRKHTLLVLGGSSAIALAYVRQRLTSLSATGQGLKVVLLGRNADKLKAEQADLEARGADVAVLTGDLSSTGLIQDALSSSDYIDEAVLAYGILTDQEKAQSDSEYLAAQIGANFTSAAVWLEVLAGKFAEQGHGQAVVLASVAGDRGRQSNYAYGSAKGGLDTFVAGLQHRFAGNKDIHFTLVKPGFVDTPMTAHIQPKGPLWAKPEAIAIASEKGLLKRKNTVYAPWFWQGIMLLIKLTPAFVFHRTKL